jgi:uncharacterized RDD family membrane protein YckC
MRKRKSAHDFDDADDELESRPADFGERLVAFMVDGLLFYGLFLASLKLVYANTPVLLNQNGHSWLLVWGALFILYHAEAAAAGRPTIGKWLLGLRVLGTDDKPLPFSRALLRAAGYVPSSAMNLGFLWAAVHPDGQSWHDLLADSKVIAAHPRPKFLVRAADVLCLAILAGAFVWQQFGAERYYRMETMACAQHSLKILAQLENIYIQDHGRYTENVDHLVSLTGQPDAYYMALANLVRPEKGIQIKVHPDGKHFTMIAYANDMKRTQIRVEGPLKG